MRQNTGASGKYAFLFSLIKTRLMMNLLVLVLYFRSYNDISLDMKLENQNYLPLKTKTPRKLILFFEELALYFKVMNKL